MKAADYLCGAGLALLTASLWIVHPALAVGGLGVLLTLAGVALYRKGGSKP